MDGKLNKRIDANKLIDKYSVICEFPRNMLLEPTNICNDSCLFCANSKCTKQGGSIDGTLARKVLKEAYELGTREVGFYGTGEPLLNQNLEEYISYAKELGYSYTYITTNGSLLSEERAKSIIEAGIDSVKFSINASNARDYLMIHGKDEFEKVTKNLISFDMLRKKYKKQIALYISYISTRYTSSNKEKFKNNYQEYVDDIAFDNCRNVDGYMANEIRDFLSVRDDMGYHPENDICPMIFKSLYITYEGYLTMCCCDFQNYLVIADLNKESLLDAWNNKYAQELRKRHLEHNLKGTLCYNCLKDCVDDMKPLRKEYAVPFDIHNWDKSDEIEKRIQIWASADV